MTEVTEVSVVCCGETVYRHRVLSLDRWQEVRHSVRQDAERMESGHLYPVVDDRPLDNPLELPASYREELRPGAEHHLRDELVCPVNPDHREVARHDKLAAALNTLAGNGVQSWPLSGIPRIL